MRSPFCESPWEVWTCVGGQGDHHGGPQHQVHGLWWKLRQGWRGWWRRGHWRDQHQLCHCVAWPRVCKQCSLPWRPWDVSDGPGLLRFYSQTLIYFLGWYQQNAPLCLWPSHGSRNLRFPDVCRLLQWIGPQTPSTVGDWWSNCGAGKEPGGRCWTSRRLFNARDGQVRLSLLGDHRSAL